MRVPLGLPLVAASLALGVPSAHAVECPNAAAVSVPGAERQEQACLPDLTTAGTVTSGHTDPTDYAGLTPRAQRNPTGVPGLQVDGYMPDDSTSNTTHGWNHDSQFVIRLPNDWNGKLIVTGAPGTRRQYASDPIVSDWVLSQGYAYAATDKGNGGASFYEDGTEPGDAGVEWNRRVTEIAVAAKAVVRQRYGRAAQRTYVTGISQGGYLTRWQLENRPDLYDGGVDWEGTLWSADGPNLFTLLPAALRHFPRYRATGDQAAHDAMIAAGFAPGSEFLWDDHYAVYWDLTQRAYREEFDPGYDGALQAGVPFCQPGTPSCDADYDFAARPPAVRTALGRIANTGRIGKPMISLHGTLDTLLPIATNGDPYRRLVEQAGKAGLHRYWVIEHGNHVDGRYDTFPDRIKPIWPCWTQALASLDRWADGGVQPPPDQLVPDVRTGDVANQCAVAGAPPTAGAGPGTPGGTPAARRAAARLRVRIQRRGRGRYVVRGRVLRPRGVTRRRACGAGRVTVTARKHGLRVARRRTTLGRRCGFRLVVRTTAKRPRFRVAFAGNGALRPASTTRRATAVRRR